MTSKIEDYAVLGNTLSAALVSRDGSIDWLCLPRFDSPACFAALLGDERNGYFRISPQSAPTSVQRRYRGDTMILETEFSTSEGKVSIIDFMPVAEIDDVSVSIVRLIQGQQGKVKMRADIVMRFDYGRIEPWLSTDANVCFAVAGPDAVRVDGPLPMQIGDGAISSEFEVHEGQAIPITLTWYPSHRKPPTPSDPVPLMHETEHWWEDWSQTCGLEPNIRGIIMRSLLTLKTLTYRPTGGIAAAATTSLPEALGGERNWDYRYCWLRDSTFMLYSLLMSGYKEEALAWRGWLERAIAGDPSDMQIMYGLAGERRLWETEIPWLPGYENSAPVRVGNKAHSQFQLDIYGEIMDTLHVARCSGIPPEEEAWYVQKAMLSFVESHWDKPDDGLWEMRGERRHFTHSKVMAWVAIDRAVKAAENFGMEGDSQRWRELRNTIHSEVCEKGFDHRKNSFVQYYGADALDASLLMIPLVGFLPPEDPRVRGTVEAVERELCVDGLVMRYSTKSKIDGLSGNEGAFLACSFWLVDNLALAGRRQDAIALFNRLLSLRNDVGLLSEEYDVVARRQVGNFPQAFSHIALINSAHNLFAKTGPSTHRARPDVSPEESNQS